MRRRIPRDREGAVELPLRLLISLVVLGIVIPIVVGVLTSYTRQDAHRVVRETVEGLFTDARQVALGGNATMRTARVTLPRGVFDSVEWVEVGDSLYGAYLTSARYRMAGESTRTIVMGSPTVRMTNARNEPLLLGAGTYDLVVWHWITRDFSFVVVDREGAQTEWGRFDVDFP